MQINSYDKIILVTLVVIAIFVIPDVYAKQLTIHMPVGDHERNLKTVIDWYVPLNHDIEINDVVNWINDDNIAHTVTSGKGIGLIGTIGAGGQGTPDGYFDSGIISPGKSWSFTFKEKGVYSYFCTIHPWIERSITVLEPGINVTENIRISYTMVATVIIIAAIMVGMLIITKLRSRVLENNTKK